MTDSATTASAVSEKPEQRASWLELFFDLVVVVAIATLTARVEKHPTWSDLAQVLIMYLAIWLVWTSFMLYANVAAERTHRRALLVAMGCIAVMAAAVPAADNYKRGQVFAIAYLVARISAGRSWRRTAKVLVDWPIAQMSFGLVPWIVSLWFHEPGRYFLWAGGLALDVFFALAPNNPLTTLQRFQEQSDRNKREQRRKREAEAQGETFLPQTLKAVDVNQSHFGERLGTFTIIVLGEAMTQIVTAASTATWTKYFEWSAVSAFFLLFGLWWLTFQYSAYTELEDKTKALPPHLALPMHYLTTAAIMLMAAGLGELILEPEHSVGTGLRWVLCGGLAAYLLVTQAGLALSRLSRPWWLALFGFLVIAAPLFLAGFGSTLAGWMIALGLALAVGGQVTFRKIDLSISLKNPALS